MVVPATLMVLADGGPYPLATPADILAQPCCVEAIEAVRAAAVVNANEDQARWLTGRRALIAERDAIRALATGAA